jgi:hypothetical protein
MTHDQIVALLTQERDYYREESEKDRDALKTIVALCKNKNFDPFGETSQPLTKPVALMSREELVARNKEATASIEKNRHVTSPDQIPMPTYEEESKLYQQSAEKSTYVGAILELMEKSKAEEKARIEAKRPKAPWWKTIFASSRDPYDPYNRS